MAYARVSTSGQELNLQIDALKNAGCKKIFKEIAKGTKTDRCKLNELLAIVEPEDIIVIWKLDRIGRSLKHLIALFNDLIGRKVSIISLQDPIDTVTAQGSLCEALHNDPYAKKVIMQSNVLNFY